MLDAEKNIFQQLFSIFSHVFYELVFLNKLLNIKANITFYVPLFKS